MKAADKDETYQNYFALMRLYYAGSDFDQADTTAEYLAGDILRCLESSGRELKSYYAARLVTLSQIMVDSFNDEGISLLSQTAAKVPNSPLNGFVDTVIANKTGLSLQRGIGLLRKTFPDSANSYTTLLQFMRGIRFISNNDRDFAVAELQAKPTNTVYCRAIQQAYLME